MSQLRYPTRRIGKTLEAGEHALQKSLLCKIDQEICPSEELYEVSETGDLPFFIKSDLRQTSETCKDRKGDNVIAPLAPNYICLRAGTRAIKLQVLCIMPAVHW